MTEKLSAKKDTWYSSFLTLSACGQASVIRIFFAPFYLPYIEHDPTKSIYDQQREWVDFYSKQLRSYTWDDILEEDNEKFIRSRMRTLGNDLCERVEISRQIECRKYLGKNRNIEQYPERFVNAVFPDENTDVFLDIVDYFHEAISCLFEGYSQSIKLSLDHMAKQNAEFYHIPANPSSAKEDFKSSCYNLAYLLCGACLLSAAGRLNQVSTCKRRCPESQYLSRVQTCLEIESRHPDSLNADSFSIKITDFIEILHSALETQNFHLLQSLYRICLDNSSHRQCSSQDRYTIQEFLQTLRLHEERLSITLSQLSGKSSVQRDDFKTVLKELNLVSDIETFWRNFFKTDTI